MNRAIDLGKRRARDFGLLATTARGELQTGDVADAAVAAVLVGQALARLSPKLRAAIVLRFYEDLSDADIASVLGVPIGTVKSRITRALEQLERFIEGRPSGQRRDRR